MNTPAHTLASRITERMAREGLINADAANAMTAKLADGKLRSEDWQPPIELAGQKKEAKS